MSQVIVHITTICLALGLPGKKSPSSQVRSLTCQGLNFSPPCARFKRLVGLGVKGCPEEAVLSREFLRKEGYVPSAFTYLETPPLPTWEAARANTINVSTVGFTKH